jgi:cytochrome c oxidase cbb3-type subunit 3
VRRSPLRAFAALLLALSLAACEREIRRARESPPASNATDVVSMSPLQPGQPSPRAALVNVYEQNAWAISEGKRLYGAFNCAGCHASGGGGGMGPPLLDDQWIYGSEPENVYATIVEGRPNGMPSFANRLTTPQVWQLVGYLRSLNGLLPADVRPGRSDHMSIRAAEQGLETVKPKQSSLPPASQQP